MSAVIHAGYEVEKRASRADGFLAKLSNGDRAWLSARRRLSGRFGTKRWSDANQAAVLEDVLKAQGDVATLIQEAFTPTEQEAESILSHIACNNREAIGRIVELMVKRAYYPVVSDVVDGA